MTERPEAPLRLSDDPVEAIRSLRVLAAAEPPGAVDAYLDRAFAERLPSGSLLAEALGPVLEGCDVSLTREAGYGAVAIPPPMDGDTDEEVAETEALIAILQSGVEVHGSCTVLSEPQIDEDGPVGEPEPYDRAVFAIALRPDDQLGWRVLAWRYFLAEQPLHH